MSPSAAIFDGCTSRWASSTSAIVSSAGRKLTKRTMSSTPRAAHRRRKSPSRGPAPTRRQLTGRVASRFTIASANEIVEAHLLDEVAERDDLQFLVPLERSQPDGRMLEVGAFGEHADALGRKAVPRPRGV